MSDTEQPRLIVAEPVGDEEYGEEEGQEDSFLAEMPVKKARHFPAPDTTALTKHFSLHSQVEPAYTGGKFIVSKDATTAWALNDSKVTHLSLDNCAPLSTTSEENEDILTFAVSPNEQLLATTNKTYMVRVYQDKKQVQCFKTMGQMCMEACFDPSSRFLAVGTADGHVKVYDCQKGFQTHNFMGHRGVIVQLAFMPSKDAFRLVSSSEDYTTRVWDLVLNKEVACMRENQGRVTCY